MIYVSATLLVVLNLVWLFLTVLGLPGNWLMVLSAAAATWLQWEPGRPWGEQMFHVWTLAGVTALAVLGEVLEFAAGVVGSHRAGGSRRGAIGAIVGGLGGGIVATPLIPVPVIGSIIGACIGAFAGALFMELSAGRFWGEALRSGIGAGHGRFWGTVAKFATGTAIWLVIAVAAFWP